MKILMLYVGLESPVRDFLRLVRTLKDAGYRIVAAEFNASTAAIKFEKPGVIENDIEETTPAEGA